MFLRNMLSLSSGKIYSSLEIRHHVPPKRWYIPTGVYGATSQEAATGTTTSL
jgi:hypothetical protein